MVKYLPDMCDNLDSQRIPITGSDRKTGSIPYYGASGVVDYVEKYIFDEELLLVSEDGANLVMRNSPIAFSVSGKTWVNNHAHVLRFSDQWLRQYVELYLNSISLEPYITGTAQPKLNQQMLNNIPIPVPDESQIRYIVTCTTCVHKLISLRKQQIAKLDELVKARFVEMFGTIHNNHYGYDERCLQDVCEQIKDGTHQTPEYTEDKLAGYKFLSSKDVTSGKIDWNHLKYIPEWLHQELYTRIAPRKGDILLAKNGTTGIAAVVDRDEVFDIYVSLALLRPIEINSIYLWAAINSAETKQQFDASLKGIGVPNLHLGEIKKARILVPPKTLQEQFAAFVAQTDQQKLTIQHSLAQLELLKKALMQKYFG